jgi:hypothetical protein
MEYMGRRESGPNVHGHAEACAAGATADGVYEEGVYSPGR